MTLGFVSVVREELCLLFPELTAELLKEFMQQSDVGVLTLLRGVSTAGI